MRDYTNYDLMICFISLVVIKQLCIDNVFSVVGHWVDRFPT